MFKKLDYVNLTSRMANFKEGETLTYLIAVPLSLRIYDVEAVTEYVHAYFIGGKLVNVKSSLIGTLNQDTFLKISGEVSFN